VDRTFVQSDKIDFFEIPVSFSVTKAAREQAHDPHLSIEERYGSRTRYQGLVMDAARKLVEEGHLLTRRFLVSWSGARELDDVTRGTTLAGSNSAMVLSGPIGLQERR
jgi:hypothetical protein